MTNQLNVLGSKLKHCCLDPKTGWTRDGLCSFSQEDIGLHIVCVEITAEFLEFSLEKGNDLSTSTPNFPGLQPGDKWCICLMRFIEAFNVGKAPKVILEATSIHTLEVVPLSLLQQAAKNHDQS